MTSTEPSVGSSSFRDPENAAVLHEGTWYRVCTPSSGEALTRLRASSLYEQWVGSGRLVAFDRATPEVAARVIDGVALATGRRPGRQVEVFSVETVDVITYPWEWPNSLLTAAARLTLDLRSRLLGLGLDLKDASAFNVQFRGLNPVFIDLGSVEAWRPNPSWNASRQFIEHFINPLAVGSGDHVTASDAWELGGRRGVRSDVARQLLPRRQRRRASLWLLQATTKPVAKNAPSETAHAGAAARSPDLARNATLSLTRRLGKQVARLEGGKHLTTWHDYGSRDHYEPDDIERKAALTRAFIEQGEDRGSLVLDVGGNDGLTAANLIRGVGARVLVLDADAGALDVLYSDLSADPAMFASITPLLGDITNLTSASGLLDAEFGAFTTRVRPTAVTCQAVLHHVVITQGTPMDLAVEALARFGAPVQVEFATQDDPKVLGLLEQIPNWSGEYSLAELIRALERRFTHVEQAGTTSATRVVVNAWND